MYLAAVEGYVWTDILPEISEADAPVFFMDIPAMLSFAWLLSSSM